MAVGPALVLGLGGILALTALFKKNASAAPGSPALPGGSSSKAPVSKNPQQPIGPIPVVLPDEFATLLAKALRDMTVQDDGTVKGPVTAESIQRATTVAAQLEQAGFTPAANALRAFISVAAKKVPSPPIDKQVKLPGVAPAVVEMVNRAINLERDPKKLRAILDSVRALPKSTERDALIDLLGETIKQTEAALIMVEALKKTDEVVKSPGLPPPSTVPTPTIELPTIVIPAAPPPQPPTVVAPPPKPPAEPQVSDTPEMRRAVNVANHLRNLQVDAGGDVKKVKGKEDKGLVMAVQKQEGITADGKAGPMFMQKLAKYTGNIPLVMYWPTSATSKNVLTYRQVLRDMADVHEQNGRVTLASQLRSAAARERGQAGIVGQMPA